uniref:UBC core domain-containing protein n=1 Tax=Arundo donax TaxID=35708 RepID=A0A0A9EZX4_ARUDO
MDLLRAVMIGPQGTPYHDGLFFFDAQFPASYPATAPVVYYHSGGLRLNLNLYACGKVCLSLLGTWHGGHSCEKWNPAQSTMLQVLISTQALVLNEKPYFNEPGYERSANSAQGQRRALEYNYTTFQHSCRTMLYSLRRPPPVDFFSLANFLTLVLGSFMAIGWSPNGEDKSIKVIMWCFLSLYFALSLVAAVTRTPKSTFFFFFFCQVWH